MPSKRRKTKAMCADKDQFPLSASRPFGGFCLRELSTLNIQTYLAGLDPTKLGHESRDKIRDVMSASLRFAVEHGLIPSDPAANLRVDRDRRGKRHSKHYVTPEQFVILIDLIPEPFATMVYVAIYTGLRVPELAALRWEDIHESSITDEGYCRGDWTNP